MKAYIRNLRILITIVITIFITSCIHRSNDFEICQFEFHSSMHPMVNYSFNFKTDSLKINSLCNSFKLEEKINESETLERFIDTLIVYYNYSIKLNKNDIQSFYRELCKFDYDSTSITGEPYIDGHGFIFRKIKGNDTISIYCRCLSRGNDIFKKENDLLDVFFKLVYQTEIDERGDSLSKDLYNEYGGELKFSKVADKPLEYSVWGSRKFETLEADSVLILNFLRGLPDNESVLIQLNHSDVDYFSKYTDLKNVYFYGDVRISALYPDYCFIQRKIDSTGNDSLWWKENSHIFKQDSSIMKFKWNDCRWRLQSKGKNFYVTKDEILKTIDKK